MATWKKITTEADLTAISASLTTTDQAISSSVATLSGSASDARNLLSSQLETGLSGSTSDARNLLASQVSGSFNLLSGSLTITDVTISSSVAALSGSASDARNVLGAISGSASDARNLLVTKISGSSTLPISNLSASLTTTDQVISSSVATLSGSASDARNVLGAISGSASDARNALVADISGSSTLPISNLSASLTTTDQVISSSVASLSGSASDARNVLGAISGSASDARNLLVTKISGSSTAPIATLSGSLTTTDQVISSSVATLSGSASDARNLLVTQISDDTTLSFTSTVQGQFIADFNGTPETVNITDLAITSDPTFNDLQVNGEATIEGDLTVKGTTTSINTTNLLVADKFALFASGSTSVTDGGVIIQSNINGTGKALGFSQANSRWSLQSSLAHNATTFNSVDAFLGTVETSTAVPSATPVYGVGTIHVKTDTEDIYIYS